MHRVDVGVAGGGDECRAVRPELSGGAEGAADAFFDPVCDVGGEGVGGVGDVGPVTGVEDRSDQGKPDRGADLADGVVERRGEPPCLSSVSEEVIAVVEGLIDNPTPAADHQQTGEDGEVSTAGVGEQGQEHQPDREGDRSRRQQCAGSRHGGAIVGAIVDSGIIITAIGSSPDAARSAV